MLRSVLAAWHQVRGIVLALAGVSLLTLFTKYRFLALFPLTVLGWVLYFFRDPSRQPALPAPNYILAPADGKVTDIELVAEPHFFKGPARRISVFLSLFDVHVQRAPCRGRVEFLRYQPGNFAPAFLKDRHSNEYNLLGLTTPRGPVGVKQITGILARRIVCWPDFGDELAAGQRFGLIKFGSRVDLFVPPDVEVLVNTGQKTYGGQTIVARWPDKH